MTYRDFLIGIGIGALVLAALVVLFAVRALLRRTHVTGWRGWLGWALRGVAVVLLLAAAVASLSNLPPSELINHPAPAAANDTVVYAPTGGYFQEASSVVGASARDGMPRWTRKFPQNNAVAQLLDPRPGLTLADVLTGSGVDVYALRDADGAMLWHIKLPAYLLSGYMAPSGYLTADASNVYALISQYTGGPFSAEVAAYDINTGAQRWQQPVKLFELAPSWFTVGDGFIFIAGRVGDSLNTPGPLEVLALDAATGAQRWLRPIVAGMDTRDLHQINGVFVAGGFVTAMTNTGVLTALREKDGAVAWSGGPGLTVQSPNVYLESADMATADASTIYITHQPAWERDAQGKVVPTSDTATLWAFDAHSGAVRWRAALSESLSAQYAAMTVSDGVLFIGHNLTPDKAFQGYAPKEHTFVAYDAATGRLLWQDNTPTSTGVSWAMTPLFTPFTANGAVYLLGLSAEPEGLFTCLIFCPGVAWLYAVNIRTGLPWWRTSVGKADITHPIPG